MKLGHRPAALLALVVLLTGAHFPSPPAPSLAVPSPPQAPVPPPLAREPADSF